MGAEGMALKFVFPDGSSVSMVEQGDRTVHHQINGGFEPETLAAWIDAVRPGAVALDVGAYTGLFSIIAASRGGRSIAIEPLPVNCHRIGLNASLNGVHVVIAQAAASDFDGVGMLRYNGDLHLTSGGTLERHGRRTHQMQVPLVTVDALALRSCAVMKIDVEGHEAKVIAGARKVIDNFRPRMIVETLSEVAGLEVARLLPDYKLSAFLDGRNAVFDPL